MGLVTCHQAVNKDAYLRIHYPCIVKLDDSEIELFTSNFESIANMFDGESANPVIR
jgi:hypothetical protein